MYGKGGGGLTKASVFNSSPKTGWQWTRRIRNHELFFNFLAFSLMRVLSVVHSTLAKTLSFLCRWTLTAECGFSLPLLHTFWCYMYKENKPLIWRSMNLIYLYNDKYLFSFHFIIKNTREGSHQISFEEKYNSR